MNIHVNPEDLMTPAIYQKLSAEARKAKLPIEVYLIREYEKEVLKSGEITIIHEEEKSGPTIIHDEGPEPEGEHEEVSDFFRLFSESSAYGMLTKNGYDTMEKLTSATKEELMAIPYFGKKKLEDVMAILAENGYSLFEEEEDEPQEEEWVEAIDPAMALTRIERDGLTAMEFLGKAKSIYADAWGLTVEEARAEILRAIEDHDVNKKTAATDELYEALLAGLPVSEEVMEAVSMTAEENGLDAREYSLASMGIELHRLSMREAEELMMKIEAEGEEDLFDEFDF